METRKLIAEIKHNSIEIPTNTNTTADTQVLVMITKELFEEVLKHLDLFGDATEQMGDSLSTIAQKTIPQEESEE